MAAKMAVGKQASSRLNTLGAVTTAGHLLCMFIALAQPFQGIGDHAEVKYQKGEKKNRGEFYVSFLTHLLTLFEYYLLIYVPNHPGKVNESRAREKSPTSLSIR